MNAVLIALCVAMVIIPQVDGILIYGPPVKTKKGCQCDTPDAAHDEISRLVRAIKFYDSLKVREVANAAEVADARRQMMERKFVE